VSVSDDDGMSIGTVGRRTKLRASAIRYYESVGLVRPARRVGGRRVYDASIFESLALIRLAQDAGFTVAETKRLMNGFDRATPASERWRSMAQRKLDDINERIEQANRMKALLERLLHCRCDTLGECVRGRLAASAVGSSRE
jgi:MerR family redox-sensitive transcriptional activator SoxR